MRILLIHGRSGAHHGHHPPGVEGDDAAVNATAIRLAAGGWALLGPGPDNLDGTPLVYLRSPLKATKVAKILGAPIAVRAGCASGSPQNACPARVLPIDHLPVLARWQSVGGAKFDVAATRYPADDTLPATDPIQRCRHRPHATARILGMVEEGSSMLWVSRRRRIDVVGRAWLAGSALFILLQMVGCGGESSDQPQRAADAGPPTSRPAAKTVSTQYPVVRFDTNLGTIAVELNAVKAPLTVRNFLNYVNDGFYTDTLIHYVSADELILGGGYTADGQPKPSGPSIRNEAHNGLENLRGTIAMARDAAAGIDSATSQFFINLTDAPAFDHRGGTSEEYGYCVFGEVVEGLDVAERISRSPTRDGGGDLVQMPDPPVVVKTARVIR